MKQNMSGDKVINKRFTKIKLSFFVIFLILLCGVYINSTALFRLKLADYYINTKNYDKAITVCRKAIRKENIYAKYKTLNASQASDIYCRLVKLLLIKGELMESAHMLKKLYAINPSCQVGSIPHFENVGDYKKFGLCLSQVGLDNNAINQFQEFIVSEKNDPLVRYYLALLYQKQGMQKKFKQQLNEIIKLIAQGDSQLEDRLPNFLGDCYYNLALKFEKNSNIKKAEEYYKKTIRISGDRLVDAYYRLVALYRKENRLIEAEAMELEFSKLTPEHEINYKLNSTMTFLGYSINEREFELFNKGKITFFWKVDSQVSEVSYEMNKLSNSYKIDNRLYEVKEVENLAPNFGVEVDSIGEGFPYGWDTDIYTNNSVYYSPVESHQIVSEEKGLGKSQCLLLDNKASRCTNCQTDYIAVNKNSFYLQSGYIKTINGNAYSGRAWFNSKKNRIVYNYAANGIRAFKWKFYLRMAIPPSNSTYCRLWVFNLENQGKAYFDDILFIELRLPELTKN